MASGDVETSKSSTAPSNKDVDPTVSMLLKGLQGQYNAGVPVYQKSLYPGVSDTTRSAWSQGSNVANGLIGSGGFNSTQSGAMGTLRGLDSGYEGLADAYAQDAPGYQAMRQTALDDAITGVTAGQLGSGLLGSRSYIQDATKAGINALAPLDYANFQRDIDNRYRSLDSRAGLGQALFGMGQQGIMNQNSAVSALGAIGSAKDADMLATRQGENDLFRRKSDAGWERLARSSAILGGTAPYGGQESSKSVPWWAAGLGVGSTIAGMIP